MSGMEGAGEHRGPRAVGMLRACGGEPAGFSGVGSSEVSRSGELPGGLAFLAVPRAAPGKYLETSYCPG